MPHRPVEGGPTCEPPATPELLTVIEPTPVPPPIPEAPEPLPFWFEASDPEPGVESEPQPKAEALELEPLTPELDPAEIEPDPHEPEPDPPEPEPAPPEPEPAPELPAALTPAATNPDLPRPPHALPEPPHALPESPHALSEPWDWAEQWSFDLASQRSHAQRSRRYRSRMQVRPARRWSHHLRGARMLTVAAAILSCVATALVVAPRSPSARTQPATTTSSALPAASPLPSKYAQQTIPAPYFRLYVRAASEYGLDWTKLAAVGKLESDQGQSQVRGVSAGANRYGAVGPAQFMPSTWARYGVDADNTGHINPYDPADAITAMAAYLKASGAPEHWGRALYSYNHSDSYVRAVVALSERFGGRG